VPQRVIDAIGDYLKHANANTCGAYLTSRRTNQVIADARSAMADFFGCDADEVVFGFNMTSLTFAMSRAIGRELKAGDEIVLTLLRSRCELLAVACAGRTGRGDPASGIPGERLHARHAGLGAPDQCPHEGGGGRIRLERGGGQ